MDSRNRTHEVIAESSRLALRKMTVDDFTLLLRMFNNPEVMKFYEGLRNEVQTRSWLEFNLDTYKKGGLGKWIIFRKTDRTPIGHCGFMPTLIDNVEEIELGYFLDEPFWHQGYATEAATTALNLGFEKFGYRRIVSAINPKNEPSVAVALRLGMKKEKTGIAKVGDTVWNADVYAIER